MGPAHREGPQETYRRRLTARGRDHLLIGGPRDGETSKLSSGEPPAVLDVATEVTCPACGSPTFLGKSK